MPFAKLTPAREAGLAAAMVLLATVSPAAAQSPQAGAAQPDIVVTATRVPTPVADIPAGVTVITRAEIERQDYQTLVEALNAVPGLRVAQSGGPGGNASVFIRGTNSNQVLVLLDGFPLNDASDAGAAYNFGVDTLADVERVEIIRGPMASLYGSGAIGGVINIILRRGTQPGVHLDANEAGGYPAQLNSSEVLSGVQGKFDYAATAQVASLRGYDSTPQRESIYTGTPQHDQQLLGTLNLGYTPVAGTRFFGLLRGRRSVFGFDALGFPTFDRSNSTGHDASLLARGGVSSLLFGGVVQTSLSAGRLQDDRRYFEALDPADPNNASNDSRYHSYRTNAQWNTILHLGDVIDRAPLQALDVTFGYEHTGDTAKVRVQSASGGYPYSQSVAASMTTDAVRAGVQATLSRLTLTGQVRQDWVLGQRPTTWRAGAVLDMPELRTRIKGAFGTAFLAPSLFGRYGVDSTGYVGNPALRPETAQGWEVGFTTDIPAFGVQRIAQIGATYFNEQINDLIEEVFSPVTTSVNVGSAHIQGVEVTASLNPARWLQVDASYTYTYPINADSNEKLLRRPQSTATLQARITPVARLTIAPELLYTGAFSDFLIDNNGFSAHVGTSHQGVIVNLTASYRVTDRVLVYASGKNLGNSKFEPVNGYQVPGATGIVGVRISM